MNQALINEYEVRRKMLLKRLDVTVQSFGWSDRAKVGGATALLSRNALTDHTLTSQRDVCDFKAAAAVLHSCCFLK